MSPDRWQQISQLFYTALSNARARARFLREACVGDEALQQEVESLLSNERSGTMLTGRRIGVYEVQTLLGAGGMGEGYRARDTKLGRDVAIKILPRVFTSDPDRLVRFEREGRVLASLNHPHIGAIYGFEESDSIRALVLELVEGYTIADRIQRCPVPTNEALTIARQIADALDAAHGRGIVHRDLKPANVKITPDGVVKVLDFGLAKAVAGDASAAGLTQSPTVTGGGTQEGIILGTVPYMSPEQARGQAVDKRTDIWAFGCVVYEMLTGRIAFAGETVSDTIAAILDREPDWSRVPESTPATIHRLLQRCLQKDARRRLRDIGDARMEIDDAIAPSRRSHAVDSIAVLPFVNAGNHQDTDYLCDGITESLINHLSDILKLRVVPRSTAFRYKGVEIDPERMGRELNVRVLLTGRMLQRGDTLNVQAELVDTATNSQLWGQKYSRKLTDMCAVEEQIAREIADTLRVKLNRADETRLARRATQDGEAYQLYLRGRYLWNRRTGDALARAIVYFQQAIDRDPAYALAYAGLADCYAVLGTFTFGAPGDTFPRAKAAAQRAIEIEENLAEAHVTLAVVGAFFEANHETAEREFRRALALNSNYAVAHQWYGMYRCFMADFQDGLAELDYARHVEPLSPMINVQLGVGFYLARRYGEAAQVLRNTLAFEPAFWPAHLFLAMVCEQQRDVNRATAEAELAVQLSERHPVTVSGLGYVLGGTSAPQHAAPLLAELSARARTEYVDPYHFALVHMALGDETSALQRLHEAVSEHSPYALWRLVDPRLDRLRANARFKVLLPDTFGSDAVHLADRKST